MLNRPTTSGALNGRSGPLKRGAAAQFERTPADTWQTAPSLGEHTADILAEAGYDPAGQQALIDQGAAAG